ncbi:MAG: ASKHA domain-containing protein, partial [Anaerolineales bacterium]
EIQLAKSAIRVGVEILLQNAGLTYADLDEFIVAGAFGTYLDLRSAVRTGMFPPLPLECFRQVGNAAGVGAKQMLVSVDKRREAEMIAGQIGYVELTSQAAFTPLFMEHLCFEI